MMTNAPHFLYILTFFGFIATTKVSAQYQTNHQQFYFDASDTSPTPKPIYSQALDVVNEGAGIWNHVFVANFAPPDLTNHRPLLVKLSPNNPPPNPFDPIWAKYLTVSTAAGDPL
eukprot:336962_1